jgi:hypothetical protein
MQRGNGYDSANSMRSVASAAGERSLVAKILELSFARFFDACQVLATMFV